MSSNENSQQSIIIRQEIILPVGWGPLPTSQPVVISQPTTAPTPGTSSPSVTAPTAPADSSQPCPCSKQTALRPYASVIIASPNNDGPGACWPLGMTSSVAVSGYSFQNGNGPISVCVKIFDHPVPHPTSADMAGASCLLTSSGVLNPGWTVNTVRVASTTSPNYIVAVSKFSGDTNSYFSFGQFTPCIGSGSGSGTHLPLTDSEDDVAPPLSFIAEVPDANCAGFTTIQLYYDDICSTPDQPIWFGSTDSGISYVLKVCRYGDKMIGILVQRGLPGCQQIWISDEFSLTACSHLLREGLQTCLAKVYPA